MKRKLKIEVGFTPMKTKDGNTENARFIRISNINGKDDEERKVVGKAIYAWLDGKI